jgi:hypothetical protein
MKAEAAPQYPEEASGYAADAYAATTAAPAQGRLSEMAYTEPSGGSLMEKKYPAPQASFQTAGPYATGGSGGKFGTRGGKPGEPAPKRMVHYSGQATLRSTEPEKVLDSAVAVVQAAGGYLEQREGLFVALRVPTERFDSLFQKVMRLGEVMSFSQDAEDIGEAMQDVESRLKMVSATLERLEALVQKAKTDAQKLRLLRELKRLREEKEVLEAGRATLTQKARFASIQLRVQRHTPMMDGMQSMDIRDFLWIAHLDPFDENRFRGRSVSRYEAPAGMVVTRKWRRPWRATSSRGSEFWGSQMDVEPRGDSRFWSEAIRSRLADGFKSVDTSAIGAFRLCRFQSYGPTPYFYWVAVRSRGDEIDLAEFYFPDADQQKELLPGILAAVERKSR